MNSWLTRARSYDVPEVYYEGAGSDESAKLHALADEYPMTDSVVPSDLRAAAESLEVGYQHLDERNYEVAASTFVEVPSAIDSLSAVIETDIASVEADTGWLITHGMAFSDGFNTVDEWPQNARVENWVDGDTLTTDDGTKVRLVGVDTPELSESCSKAEDALAAAVQLAPPGTEIVLYSPWLEKSTDKYGRELHYVDLTDGTDVGYSLLLSDLAEARYDSRDGYRWHVREKAYRDTGAEPGLDAACSFEEPPLVQLADDEERDDPRRERYETMRAVDTTLKESGESLGKLVVDARESHERADQRSNRGSNQRSTGNDSESFDFPDSLCPTRWC